MFNGSPTLRWLKLLGVRLRKSISRGYKEHQRGTRQLECETKESKIRIPDLGFSRYTPRMVLFLDVFMFLNALDRFQHN